MYEWPLLHSFEQAVCLYRSAVSHGLSMWVLMTYISCEHLFYP